MGQSWPQDREVHHRGEASSIQASEAGATRRSGNAFTSVVVTADRSTDGTDGAKLEVFGSCRGNDERERWYGKKKKKTRGKKGEARKVRAGIDFAPEENKQRIVWCHVIPRRLVQGHAPHPRRPHARPRPRRFFDLHYPPPPRFRILVLSQSPRPLCPQAGGQNQSSVSQMSQKELQAPPIIA